jgi:serine/threonine protein kinase
LLILKLAQAVEEAHQRGIVHRDLKPANIIIDHNKEPVIMDFGLARLAEAASNLTQSGLMIETPAYMAPEQVRGELDRICPASDIYSLGAIMCEMLTGQLAFEGSVATVVQQTLIAEPDRPSHIAPSIAPGMSGRRWVMGMWGSWRIMSSCCSGRLGKSKM